MLNNFSCLKKLILTAKYCMDVHFETPVCKFYLLFLTADAAQEKEK
jgi:hypothetical protein